MDLSSHIIAGFYKNRVSNRIYSRKKERFSVTDQDTLTVLGREYPVVYGNQVHFNGTVFEIPQNTLFTNKTTSDS